MTENNLISFVLGCIGNKVLKSRQISKFKKFYKEHQHQINKENLNYDVILSLSFDEGSRDEKTND